MADVTETTVRQWLRDHPGAHCAECVARDLGLDEAVAVRAAMDDMAPSQIFSLGPCACGATGLSYRSPRG
jgi:hypothetical protein